MSKKIRGTCLIVVGLLMVSAGIGLIAMYDHQDELAGRNADILLAEVAHRPVQPLEKPDEPQPEEEPGKEMPVQTYLGYEVVGTVCIPSVGIELPVLNEWSYDLLKIAPCRYSGSIEGRDLILLGHNYKSHFAPLKRAEVGSTVEFYGVDNTMHHYRVSAIEILHKTEVERLPSSEHDLTIFTCTASGQSRLVVRCDLQLTSEDFEAII